MPATDLRHRRERGLAVRHRRVVRLGGAVLRVRLPSALPVRALPPACIAVAADGILHPVSIRGKRNSAFLALSWRAVALCGDICAE